MPNPKITDAERAAVVGHFVARKDNTVRDIITATGIGENRVRTILNQYLDRKKKF